MVNKVISFQGMNGAWSHQAAKEIFCDATYVGCKDFMSALEMVANGEADATVIPVENTIAGRVADIHALIPKFELFITKEHYINIQHKLLIHSTAKLSDIKEVYSHIHALGQCRYKLKNLNIESKVGGDTAGSAAYVKQCNDNSKAAIAAPIAAEIYGLDIADIDIMDSDNNVTRFFVLEKEPVKPSENVNTVTSLLFKTKSVPSALYKALGGFATNGVNVTRIESYQVDNNFNLSEFIIDVEGAFGQKRFDNAYEELKFFSQSIRFLGNYEADVSREENFTGKFD